MHFLFLSLVNSYLLPNVETIIIPKTASITCAQRVPFIGAHEFGVYADRDRLSNSLSIACERRRYLITTDKRSRGRSIRRQYIFSRRCLPSRRWRWKTDSRSAVEPCCVVKNALADSSALDACKYAGAATFFLHTTTRSRKYSSHATH